MIFMESKYISNDVNKLNILIYLLIYVIPKTDYSDKFDNFLIIFLMTVSLLFLIVVSKYYNLYKKLHKIAQPKTSDIVDHPIITTFLISPLLALEQCAILNISTSREHSYNLCTS